MAMFLIFSAFGLLDLPTTVVVPNESVGGITCGGKGGVAVGEGVGVIVEVEVAVAVAVGVGAPVAVAVTDDVAVAVRVAVALGVAVDEVGAPNSTTKPSPIPPDAGWSTPGVVGRSCEEVVPPI